MAPSRLRQKHYSRSSLLKATGRQHPLVGGVVVLCKEEQVDICFCAYRDRQTLTPPQQFLQAVRFSPHPARHSEKIHHKEAATFPYLLQTIFRIHNSQLKEDKSGVIQAVWQRGYERARGREITQNYEVQSLDLPPMLEQNDCRPNCKRLHHSRVRTKNELWRLPVRRTRTTQAQTLAQTVC